MTDSLIAAAERLGVATDESAGPGTMPGEQLWSRWPRHRLELAHDVLDRILALHQDATLARDHDSADWRAWCGDWFFEGNFEDVVGALGMHLTDQDNLTDGERADSGRQPLVAHLRLGF